MPEHATARPARSAHRQSRTMFDRWRGARPSIGNWFRIEYPVTAVTNDLIEREERRKERVRLLLDRYGILFRELLVRELPELRWAALFRSLRLMELSGEVLAGHFFDSIEGLQFISPKALRLLQHPLPDDAVYWLNAADPASVCGLGITPLQNALPKRLPGVHLVYHGAAPVIISHQFGRRLDIRVPADHPRLGDYFCFLEHLLTRAFMPLRSVRIQSINGLPAATQSAYVAVLQALFETVPDNSALLLYRRHLS
jgi:ATP-dependent Lhr-like helicase